MSGRKSPPAGVTSSRELQRAYWHSMAVIPHNVPAGSDDKVPKDGLSRVRRRFAAGDMLG